MRTCVPSTAEFEEIVGERTTGVGFCFPTVNTEF